jgi:1-deoxy-D-xylulose-5-phosphate reductoisomerase
MTKLVILGATGSIGTTCLNALRNNNPGIIVTGLSARKSREKLESLSKEFSSPSLLTGENISSSGLSSFLDETKPDIVLNAIAGFDGLYATKCVLEKGIDLALSNKESVVAGASFIFSLAKEKGARIIPVDSEHSAIYNLLKMKKASSLVITASGGPFVDRKNLDTVTLSDALKHPTWKMGEKITIDSATLANKGLEVIEASYLFGFPPENIEVTVHRQSVVHSLIRTPEGAVYAQMSPPDMTLPIMGAIAENRMEISQMVRPLDFTSLTLTFEKPDTDRFPLLKYAYKALGMGYRGPVIYNASDEVAVGAFVRGEISFTDIARVVALSLDSPSLVSKEPSSYDEVYELDRNTRAEAERIIREKPWLR